ncbi:MAG TPA: DUF6691 family protein [Aestuariivirgaceae bacterium]
MQIAIALMSGLLFGMGLAISGMVNPAKVLNFFDIAGSFDPSLAFVMAGSLAVTWIGYRYAWRQQAPAYASKFHLPSARDLDAKLVGGSALFGLGWGLSGFCPGPAIASLTTFSLEPVIFLVGMVAGMLVTRLPAVRTA